jgi:diguanylate cyclase (GGDEF)-like protein
VSNGRAVSAPTRIVVLAVTMGAVAATLVAAAPGGPGALVVAPWWMIVAIAAGFAVAERAVFHLEHRREAMTVSLSEVPMLYAAVFLDLRLAILARIVFGVGVVLAWRRAPAFKTLFTIAQFAVEVAISGFLIRLLLDGRDQSVAWYAAVAVLAVSVASIVGSILVSAAVAQFEGGFLERAGHDLKTASWMCVLYASIGGLVMSPALLAPWLAPFAVGPLVVFWLYLRRQATLAQQLHDVQDLNGFAGRVAGEVDLQEIGRVAVEETSSLLRAADCALLVVDESHVGPDARFVVLSSHGTPIDVQFADGTGWPDVDDSERRRVRVLPDGSCAAPLLADRGVIGALVVRGRLGVSDDFGAADLERLQTLADQLSATVARGLLHRKLEVEAHHDSLTGLANRTTFERVTLEPSSESTAELFVLMLDLDRFKEVNDTLGHAAGDELLVEVANRLRDVVSPDDTLARFAGDEFAITGVRDDLDAIDALARECVERLGQRYTVGGMEIVVNASVGVSTGKVGDPSFPTAMLRQADIAMYHAKQHHLGHEFFRPELDRRTPARLSMLGDLRAALDHGRLHQHFQPKLDLVTGLVIGAEVLVRWDHPTRGAIPLTDEVLESTVRAIARLDAAGHPIGLSMNISPHDLLDELLVDRIARRLDQHLVPSSRLTLEITEGTLLYDSPRTQHNIARLHEMGVRLSIDDFGTGYSSLRYLRQLPVSELKIDKGFIFDLMADTHDETIVRSTIDLGHNLGLRVVAEGVETDAVAHRLHDLGCDVAQGYGISRPVSFGHLLRWLDDRRPNPALAAWSIDHPEMIGADDLGRSTLWLPEPPRSMPITR